MEEQGAGVSRTAAPVVLRQDQCRHGARWYRSNHGAPAVSGREPIPSEGPHLHSPGCSAVKRLTKITKPSSVPSSCAGVR